MDPSPHRILVLDDDADLRVLLQRYLGQQGLQVRALESPAQLERLLAREPHDVLVLDLMMPGEDGLSVLRRLRAQGETIPVLMLTARGDPVDRIVGLEMGADDYLAKPFDPRELLARVQALVRRQRMRGAPTAVERGQQALDFGGFQLDFNARRLLRAGTEVELTSGEYALLAVLARHPGRALGRERLLELAHGRDHDGGTRSVDVRVLRLRRVLEADSANPRYIRTVWGVGYMFTPEGTAA